ncbi:ABC transporter permease [Treponema phagedenis]|uniref:ABC transporter permease n=1 Tax=Treponema phagedenis TaxID=162 RepID=A0A0B7GYX7_TREPH|nr:ABC transporter permease [Treponema phagedenis]EFW37253.1 ABC transporter, permease protein [Treponema phagedenis F0421]NVP24957.1 ABC transporter permease [Treponema phagedenis]QEJ94425.1 ABC transporter permease [Treponema phagedenis]QEJ96668.1 ABC transporter permease [Treponema phagedenis]QEK01694.1 ABC transporter permease [Treponema phagedenis]
MSKSKSSLKNRGFWYTFPMSAWFTVFFVMPLVIIAVYSFLKKGLYGGVLWQFSPIAYVKLFTASYGILFMRTLWVSFLVTLICILLALPAGYAIARSKYQIIFLFLIIIPFWTNSLIRINAWIAILGNQGFLNEALKKFGLIQKSLPLMYNQASVVMVLVYMYLPYSIFPIFSAIDKFDFSLLEAARDLGATKFGAIRKVMLPNVRAGIVTSVIFTFIPVFGAYTVPLLVGGKNSYMIGNVIVDQVTKIRNWPLASAFSVLIALVSTAGVIWMMMLSVKQALANKKQGGPV